jgi:hypothetical protein
MEGLGSGETLLTSVFIAYETAFAFSQYLPSVMTIHTFVDTEAKVKSIRTGELIASVFAGAFALAFAAILRSWLPLCLAGLAIVGTVVVYEWALQGAPAFESANGVPDEELV